MTSFVYRDHWPCIWPSSFLRPCPPKCSCSGNLTILWSSVFIINRSNRRYTCSCRYSFVVLSDFLLPNSCWAFLQVCRSRKLKKESLSGRKETENDKYRDGFGLFGSCVFKLLERSEICFSTLYNILPFCSLPSKCILTCSIYKPKIVLLFFISGSPKLFIFPS